MKKIILAAILLTGTLTFAQKGELSISGSVDVYGTVNTVDGPGAPGLLIDHPDTATMFGLGMANTVFGYKYGKSGAVVDLAYGPRAEAAAGFGGIINQLYAYYTVNDKLTITAGQFNTFLGYEVISPASNFNYTVSYLFNAGPFSHIGAKADYAVSKDLSLMLAITNPHGEYRLEVDPNGNTVPPSGDAQLGFQVGYKGQYLNLAYGGDGSGVDDALYLDYTGGFNLAKSTYLGINAAYSYSNERKSGYQGVALYLQQTLSDSFSLGLRPEYFQKNKDASDNKSIYAFTLTANEKLTENLKIVADARLDTSNDQNQIFENNPKTNYSQLTIAAVYSF